MAKATELKKGDSVEWETSQGKTSGEIIRKVTSTTKVKGHVAKATKAEPEFEVKSAKSCKTAIHLPEGLKKL